MKNQQTKIQRFQQNKYQLIETEVAQKRLAWFKQYSELNNNIAPPGPRTAYELLFFEYLGLSENDVPIISETESEIVWHSKNQCSTLTMCQELKLDTKKICRAVYEKSTQALISQLDPQLRFLRDYQQIRPYSDYCLEKIVKVDFEQMMKLAIEEAKISRAQGNKGYGAVVSIGKQILAKAHDTAGTEKDPSLHAEVNAIRQAVKTIGDSNLSAAVLVSTCEPCPMCSSLAVWANLSTIVYGASIKETAELGKARILVSSKEIVKQSPVMIEIIEDVLKNECLELYID